MTYRTTSQPHQIFKRNRPRVGAPVTCEGVSSGVVTEVEGGICYTRRPGEEPSMFIWCFRSGLNKLHDWPQKGRN